MPAALNIGSEIGKLKRVIVHTPGPEIEAMSPDSAEEDLYNDIIPLGIVKTEHNELKTFLSTIAKTYEVADLLEETLKSESNRIEFVNLLVSTFNIPHRTDDLGALDSKTLTRAVIHGLPAKHETLTSHLDGKPFDLKPLPNMYFMRDSALVYRNSGVSCAMRFDVRHAESMLTRFIFSHHADFSGKGVLFDGGTLRKPGFSLEGGDFQVVAPNVIAIGMSERTSPQAIDFIAQQIVKTYGEKITIFAVDLPKARATIHLDMAFTCIDHDACLVYEPVILGKNKARVIRLDVEPNGKTKIRDMDGLIEGLRTAGIDMKPILAGGSELVHQQREQWMSGANSFAFAPGKIIMYSCNIHTIEALNQAGFEVKRAKEFNAAGLSADSYKRLVVGFDGVELARGGGGARCMTMPVERE